MKSIFVDHFQITLIIFYQNFSGYSPKHCLFSTTDKWKKTVDNKVLGALTDLSKVFDCICYDLLVAKLNACDLSFPAIKWYSIMQRDSNPQPLNKHSNIMPKRPFWLNVSVSLRNKLLWVRIRLLPFKLMI